jgi:bifunctional non-homologous end joining protein LigD
MNVWEDEVAREAIVETGRRRLIVFGLLTEACVTFSVLSALAAGFEVYVGGDACGARHGQSERRFAKACRCGWEGLIAKRADAPYTHGRSRDWLKLKCVLAQELVIGGYTEPAGSRSDFGALLVGYYEGGRLRYAGRVGTGYSATRLKELGARLPELQIAESPFADAEPIPRGTHWTRPELVARIGFAEWTGEGRLRQPRFLGLRDDKPPTEVVREQVG